VDNKKPPRRLSGIESNVQGGKSKNPFFQNFFISFHVSIYNFNHYQKYTNFQSNAQAEAIVEVPSGVEGSTLLRGACFAVKHPQADFNEICVIRGYISLRNQRNLRLISSCLFVAKHNIRHTIYFLLSAIVALHLSRVLYKSTLFMQNKPNLLDTQMNVRSAITMNYEQLTMNYANKNKPNSKPIKPNTNPIAKRV